ncbi:MAG: polymer-forming cytoskeletal protein [Chloroflexota bacterium]|nr:polymer-forming cytoskeletal protein [Chloroflexota bacterium]
MQQPLTPRDRPTRIGAIIVGVLIIGVIVTLIARAVLPFARATDAMSGGVILEADYRLEGAIEGDLVVFGNTVTIPAGARVSGDAWFVADTIQIDGQIDGALTAIADTVIVTASGRIAGDAALMVDETTISGRIDGAARITGDRLTLSSTGQIGGTATACVDQIVGNAALLCDRAALFAPFAALIALREGAAAGVPVMDWSAPLVTRNMTGALTLLAVALGMVGIAALMVATFPRQISHIEDAIRAKPRGMGGAGLALYGLALGISGGVIVLLAVAPPVGLVLIPVYLLLLVGLFAALFAGVVTLALVVGEWLTARLGGRSAERPNARGGTPPLVTAAAGGAVLWLGVAAAAVLPFGVLVGGVMLIAVSAVGAGAALFTRLGTRPLRGSYFVQG